MEKVKAREKFAYGLGDLGNNVAYGALGFYLVFFLTDVAGISPAWAGYIFLIVRMWNAVFDMIMGVISDRTKSRFGRRRPYLLFGAIPLSIGFALLWQVFFKDTTAMIIYYTIAGILFSTLYSLVAIPYNALLPEISQDYDERTSISGYKMALSFVGSLFSAMGGHTDRGCHLSGQEHVRHQLSHHGRDTGRHHRGHHTAILRGHKGTRGSQGHRTAGEFVEEPQIAGEAEGIPADPRCIHIQHGRVRYHHGAVYLLHEIRAEDIR